MTRSREKVLLDETSQNVAESKNILFSAFDRGDFDFETKWHHYPKLALEIKSRKDFCERDDMKILSILMVMVVLVVAEEYARTLPVKVCRASEVCAWGFYEGNENKTVSNHNLSRWKDVVDFSWTFSEFNFLPFSCRCPRSHKCIRSEDEPERFAFVYRCKPKGLCLT